MEDRHVVIHDLNIIYTDSSKEVSSSFKSLSIYFEDIASTIIFL